MSGNLQSPRGYRICHRETSSYGLKKLYPLLHLGWVDTNPPWCHPYWHDPLTWPGELSPFLFPVSERSLIYPNWSFTVRAAFLLILSLLKILHLSIAQCMLHVASVLSYLSFQTTSQLPGWGSSHSCLLSACTMFMDQYLRLVHFHPVVRDWTQISLHHPLSQRLLWEAEVHYLEDGCEELR